MRRLADWPKHGAGVFRAGTAGRQFPLDMSYGMLF